MLRVLVCYYSQTGNTEQVARAIYAQALAAEGEAQLKALAEVVPADLAGYDLVFLGSACHSTDLAEPVKAFLDGLPQAPGCSVAGFATHAVGTPGQAGMPDLHETWAGRCPVSFATACEAKRIPFLGYFSCMGAPSAPIEQFIHHAILPDEAQWQAYIPEARTHPDAEDLQHAAAFAERVLTAAEG